MRDSFLLWLFVKIGMRWFQSVVFATNPETERTTSIFFFDDQAHAKQFMNIVEREKLNHKLEKKI